MKRVVTLQPLFMLLAFVAMLIAPIAGFSTLRAPSLAGTEEQNERAEEGVERASLDAAPAVRARRTDRRPQPDRRVVELRPASRHVPGFLASHTPTPNPCWTRPRRC